MIALYHPESDQDDFPDWAARKTFYSESLCTTLADIPDRAEARERLGLPKDRQIVVALSGGGVSGANFALPDTLWLTVGPVRLEGYEAEFREPQAGRLGRSRHGLSRFV